MIDYNIPPGAYAIAGVIICFAVWGLQDVLTRIIAKVKIQKPKE